MCKIACHPKCCALIEPNCHVRSSTASTTPSYNPDRYPDIPEFKLPSHPLPTPPSHRQSAPPVPRSFLFKIFNLFLIDNMEFICIYSNYKL